MSIETRWAFNAGVRLEYLLEPGPLPKTPLAHIPGVVAEAQQIHEIVRPPAGRTLLSMSLRGRGLSDTPEHGYAFADHAADVQAVLEASGLERFALMGWSFGVRLAVHYAAHHPEKVCKLVLLDGRVNDFVKGQGWVDLIASSSPQSRPLLERIRADSLDIDLEQLLPRVQCPVLIVRAGGQGSGLPLEEAERYVRLLSDARLVSFDDSPHEVWEPNYGRFRGRLEGFLDGPA
jgi:pimeloyl-ACP methyl ester carboxylesterase